jgi:transcriptional regulator with XRE-family HTH domain
MKQKVQKFDIKKLRKQLGLTQEQAASSIGMSTRNWQRIESNPVSLPMMVEFIQANGGVFKVPENPFDVFVVGDTIFSQKDFAA